MGMFWHTPSIKAPSRFLAIILPILTPLPWQNGVPVYAFSSPVCQRFTSQARPALRPVWHTCPVHPSSLRRHTLSLSAESQDTIAEEEKDAAVEKATRIISSVMGERGSSAFEERRRIATAQQDKLVEQGMAKRQLVYGELQLDRFIMLLEAAGVKEMAAHRKLNFLDIGSGDGQLVLAAALVYSEVFGVCRGAEVVPGLARRSLAFEAAVRNEAEKEGMQMGRCELVECDVLGEGEEVRRLLAETDVAVCFATTWDHDSLRRGYVPRLSRQLAAGMGLGGVVVMVDKRLCEEDGWYWEGSLDFANADVAPYSTAHLYRRE